MRNYLIFRSDKIGDFLITAILIKSIQRNDPDAKISIVGSKENINYIKSFNNITNIFILKNNFFSKISLIFNLIKKNFHSIIVADGKKRSVFVSFFLKSKNKILLNYNNKSLFIKFFFNKIFYPNIKQTHIDTFKEVINYFNFNFDNSDLNILAEKQIALTKKNNKSNFYSLFHFDEKWVHNLYIKNYTNIEPNLSDFIIFINNLQKKTGKNLIITSGIKSTEIFLEASKNNLNDKISFLPNLNFLELEKIIIQSNLVIACHGSVSHVASAAEVKQIDVIEDPSLYSYNKWTSHFRLYNKVYRTNFKDLSSKILNLV